MNGNTRYNESFAITRSDTVDIPGGPIDAFYVGGGGTVVAVLENGDTVTLLAAIAGTVYPIACKRINSTNTTATSLVGLRMR